MADNTLQSTNADDDIDLLMEDPEREAIEEMSQHITSLILQTQREANPWGISPRGNLAKRLAMAKLSTKNGLHARVPIVCKADSCPYAEQCPLLPYGAAPEGEFCSVELAQIELRAAGYSQDVDYDTASFTDKNLISELITLDVMLERCKALMAKDGSPVIEMAIGIDQEGNEVRQPAVSKAWEAYEKISKKRDQVYHMLMLTRSDHKNDGQDSDAQSVSDVLHDVINATDIEV